MWSSRIDETGSLYLRATTDNSGTWRVKYGQCETVYHVSESDLCTVHTNTNHEVPTNNYIVHSCMF